MFFFWIFIALLVAATIYLVSIYNTLIAKRNQIINGFAQIDVQLTRRYELIPNLVEAVKKYMSHERETLTNVIAARNQAASALATSGETPSGSDIAKLAVAEQALGAKMRGFVATFENYPELKADQTIQQLQEELNSTENRVAFARQHYNDLVNDYNTTAQEFPANIISGLFKFNESPWLEIDDIEVKRKPLKIDIN
ncbi:MAG: hypothetical protein CSA10_01200 [Cardiobacteriales bacterium]|nr:MAG: hypothetical protein CSA10_01200 [Cardiobacteriales bacterium]